MKYLFIILAFICLSGYSQSVHIDGPTGTAADLSVASSADSADIILFEQSGTSKSITAHALHAYAHAGGLSYVSTPGQMTIATGETFEKLYEDNIAYSSDHLVDFTESNGRLTYTGTRTAHVTIVCNVSIESDETAQIVQLCIAKNGSTIAGTNMTREFTAVNKDSCVGLNWMDELVADDYIEIFGTSDQNGDQFQVNNLTLSIIKH